MNPPSAQRALRQHVQTDQLLGVDAVPMSNGGVTGPSVGGEEQASAISTPQSAQTKQQLLEAMDLDEVRVCTKCPLGHSRTRTVFGEGNPDAQLMFIGEGPGRDEDRAGRPFVGRAGEMLSRQITAIGLTRQQVYIANVVKCRPPNNRVPTATETDACWGYLKRQIQIIEPTVIVTLGGPATKLLLETKKGITAIRGTWHKFEGLLPHGGPAIAVMPTFHPAYLLRAYTPENRKKVWDDLKKAVARVQGDD